KKAAVKKATAKKAAAKKPAAKKAAPKKAAVKKAAAKKPAAKKKAPAKKAAVKKAKKSAPRRPTSSRAAAEVWGIKSCGSTRKAMKLLDAKSIPYAFKDFKEEKPPKTLLRDALKGMDGYRKAFNTSGASYKDGNWKEKVDGMNKEQVIDAFTADPMLIKRPVVKGKKGVSIGYDEDAIMKTVK
ncbi:MAG: Spx/MgsR family RNA polymerase-binding regulatory protein, partial [Bacteroidota bacterium]|nr:Spx/MgsR family RNA polymerase-binding regulatory protein [Bacteroidota bacterium]